MIFKGFVLTSTNIKTLLTKLNNHVVCVNTNNLANTTIQTFESFNLSNPNKFVESSNPDLIAQEDDAIRFISDIGSGDEKITVAGSELFTFSGNGFIGSDGDDYGFTPDISEYGILFPHTDWSYFENIPNPSNMQVWRNSSRFHIFLNRIELSGDGSPAEVSIHMYYDYVSRDVFIYTSGLINFELEDELPFRFGICGESSNIETDPSILKINIDELNFNELNIDELKINANIYKLSGLTIDQLRTANFDSQQILSVGFAATELRLAGFSIIELKSVGFSIIELKSAGFNDFELLSGGFNISDLIIASGLFYTKLDIDNLLDIKIIQSSSYTKIEVDNLLETKPNINTIYTKLEIDNLLDIKIIQSSSYTKLEVDNLLETKQNINTTYTKPEVDNLLKTKPNINTIYTKPEVDSFIKSLNNIIEKHITKFNTLSVAFAQKSNPPFIN